MNFEKPRPDQEIPQIKRLEDESGEKDWTYERLQKMVKYVIEKFWGDKFKVEGKENVPKNGSAIIACNHSSHIDPEFLMAAIDRPIHFIGLQDRKFNPAYVRVFYKLAGVIGVSRDPLKEGGRAFVQKLQEVVKNGELIGIFPEGILEEKKDKSEIVGFKSGVFSIAKKYGLDVVPVHMSGTDKVRPRSQPRLLQKIKIEPVEVRIGEILKQENIKDVEDVRQAIVALGQKKSAVKTPEK